MPRVLALVLLAAGLVPIPATQARGTSMHTIINFDNGPREPRWVAVNDGVMGGFSRGGPWLSGGHLEFRGALSLANNGGFASVRTTGRAFDLAHAKYIVLRVRGDGRRYQLRLATDARRRGARVSFGAGFDTEPGRWTEVRVPLDALEATVRGTVLQVPPMDRSRVSEIGLLIADKREGPFALTVDWIALE